MEGLGGLTKEGFRGRLGGIAADKSIGWGVAVGGGWRGREAHKGENKYDPQISPIS